MYSLCGRPLGSVTCGKVISFVIPLSVSFVDNERSLGDSGFLIIRSSQIFYQQKPQTHYFNCPRFVTSEWIFCHYEQTCCRQLSKTPPSRGRRRTHYYSDSPTTADTYSTYLQDGDIIIAYVRCNFPYPFPQF